MGAAILFIFYGSIVFFVLASLFRVKRCIEAPVHLHWDLYRQSSIYEQQEWWTKVESTFARKFFSMLIDVLLLRDFYYRNRRFWYPLYIFHAGLYSLFLWHLWLFVRALIGNVEAASISGWVWGTSSTILTFAGAIAILFMRLKDEELKVYYPPIHYLKWIFVLLTLAGGAYAVDVHFGSSMPDLLKYVRDQVTFADLEKKLRPSFGPALHVLFVSAWLVYLPFSHVYQLFFRYYHYLRWDEVPYTKASVIDRKIKDQLELTVSWSAPHIDGGRSWRDVVSGTKNSGSGDGKYSRERV